MLGGQRASQAEDTAKAYYQDNPAAARRCMELAIKSLKWMQAKEDGRYKLAPHEDVEIVIEVPLAVKNALMMLGRETRDPGTNRRLGLTGVVRRIVIEYVKRQFPLVAKEIELSIGQTKRNNPDSQFGKPRRRPMKMGVGELFDVETSKQDGSKKR